ncbi:MAG: DnaA/Hda family protein [Hyphomicrobiales bacterium]
MADTPKQLAFDLAGAPAMGRDDFLVSPSNAAALAVIDRWPDWPGPVAVLAGPAGSGKTHLASIWAAVAGATVLPAPALTVESVPGLVAGRAVVVEDAPGEALEERALFHLFNLAREARASVLLTSREEPALWPVALPDLRSRLKAALVVRIEPPDDALLRAVLVKLFADRQLAVDEGAVGYLLARMHRSLGEARDLVAEIDSRALAERAEVSRAFLARVLAERGQDDLFGD